jgi:hypothetical protein
MYKARHIVFGALAFSPAAFADESGIGSDTVQLVPAVSVGGEYRSNLYLDEGIDYGGRPIVQGTALLINPTLGVKVNSNVVSLRLGSGYGARKYLQEDLQNLNTFNDGRLTASGRFLPKSPVGLSFSESFSSNNRPVNQPKADSALIRVYDNKSRVGLSVGNGNAVDINVGGTYNYRQINGMVDSQGNQEVINQRNTYGGVGTASWKFLPKTKFVVDGTYTMNDWVNNTIETTEETTTIQDSSVWNMNTGLEGQLSGKTLLRFMIGAGGSTYGEGDAVTQLEGLSQRLRLDSGLRIKPSESHDFRIEYKRAFQDVYFTSYNLYHQLGLTYEVNAQDRILFSVNGQYRNDNYDGPVDRTDHRIQAGGAFTINFADHGAFETALNWRRLASADEIVGIEYDDLGLKFGVKWGY